MPEQQHGLLVLDKPKGPSSTRCLEKIKWALKQKKIGHAGTLDPMATGVLLVLLGHGTKVAQYLLDGDKTYQGLLTLGRATDTYDAEGVVVSEAPWEHLDPEVIRSEVMAWRELTEQEVPPYSAAKHNGQPLYKLSREGRETPVKIKTIHISAVEILAWDLPRIRFRVTCGAGTYIRSLAHSLGMRLGCGAVLEELIRERSHPFGLDQAHSLDTVLAEPDSLAQRVLPLATALPHWPHLELSEPQAKLVRNGGQIEYVPEPGQGIHAPGTRAMLTAHGEPLALVELRIRHGIPVWAILRGL
ncbi:MAG: tRNA pseudouridine(55) synthase TruB [Desulfovibrionaceae bacterium]